MAEYDLRVLLDYKQGIATWNLGEVQNIVYLLVVGDETYVGTTYQPRNRFVIHLGSLQRKTHRNPLIQQAFDKTEALTIYLLEDCKENGDRYKREKHYIRQLKPTLNREHYYKEWSFSGLTKRESVRLLCDVITYVRKKKCVSLKQLADALNIDRKLIKRLERYDLKLSANDITRLLLCLGLTIHEADDKLHIRHYGHWSYKKLIQEKAAE